ncbi:unnamed protein product, partial [marine sediment metagenome]
TGANDTKIQQLTNNIGIAEAALGQYGIGSDAFDDAAPIDVIPDPDDVPGPAPTPTPTPTPLPDEVPPGQDTTPPPQGDGTLPPAQGDGATTPPFDQLGGEGFRLPQIDLVNEPTFITNQFGPRAQRSPEEKAVAAELTAQINAQNAQRQGNQLGINELLGATNQFSSDPFFQGIRDQGTSLMEQDNFDFTGIKNQAVADQQQAFQQLLGQLGGSAAERNLSTASLGGIV